MGTALKTPATASAAAAAPGAPRVAWHRLPLLAFGFVALLVGVGAGLARLGWTMPDAAAGAAALHGPLMVCGFFGVVIALERAVAIGRAWAYGAPLLAGLGTAAALHGGAVIAPWLYLAGSVWLLVATLDVLRRQRAGFVLVITLGTLCWAVGTALWALGAPVQRAVGWWLAFLVLTIAGERLELSRMLPPSRAAARAFAAIVALVMVALAGWELPGMPRLFGAALLLLSAWLLRQDVARRTVRQRGLTRFIAVCLLAGYGWLAVGGTIVAVAGLAPGSAAYDAAVHAVLLGFVFSMVFGHAPIIVPALLRTPLPYRARFYAPLVLLHASVLLRLAGGAAGSPGWTRWGAWLSAVALLVFVASTVVAVWHGRRAGARTAKGAA